jgi:glycosyltransferase involved in cell wall biosynthesis
LSLNISVAMCTFNGERFLGSQLESIAAQERQPDELVICDDGSSDGSCGVVREFAARVPFPVRLVVNTENLGVTKNFEKAISLCEGSIIALADQDDVWYRQKLKRLELSFTVSNATVAAFSDADLVDEESRPLNARLWGSFSFGRREQTKFRNHGAVQILAKRNVVTGATLAFRKEYFEVLAPLYDVHDAWMAFLLAASGYFEAIPERLMQYRRHANQQLGPGAVTWQERLARIKRIDTSFYRKELEHSRKLHDRLVKYRTRLECADLAEREIKNKCLHLERRVKLPTARVARVADVLRETVNGDYRRYSGGWKSAAKDLIRQP